MDSPAVTATAPAPAPPVSGKKGLEPVGTRVAPILSLLTSHPTREHACPGCGESFTQLQAPASGAWVPYECETCETRATEAEAETANDEFRARQRAARLDRLNLPRQYASASLDRVLIVGTEETRQNLRAKRNLARRYVAAWGTRHDNPRFPHLVAMRGAPGTFKTHLACAIARELVTRHDATVVVATMGDIVRDLREAWRAARDGESEAKRLARYHRPDLLVIDEVSRHALYGEQWQHLYDLVAARERDLAATILTTNEDPGSFEELVGPAISSRLARWNGLWEFGSEDLRPLLSKFVSADVAEGDAP